MKDFIKKYRKFIIFSVVIVAILAIFTTTAITTTNKTETKTIKSIDDISVVSKPTGKVVAKGIDVSRYQGDIDFNKVKEDGFSFVIIRVATGQAEDSNFESNYEKAKDAGLDIGCYYYTYSTTKAGAKEDAKEVLSFIKGKSFSYPVFYDFEYEALRSYSRVDENTAMINTFCKVMKRNGYYPGVYSSNNIYNNYFDNRKIGATWDVWVASYRDQTSNYTGFSKDFSIWQYTSNGGVSGIQARVDLNVCYVNYPKLIKQFNTEYKQLSE